MLDKDVLDEEEKFAEESVPEIGDIREADMSSDNPGPAEVDSIDLEGEIMSLNEKLLRQAAEFQNYRRRTERENREAVAIGKSLVVQRLLDVLDDLERSLEASGQETDDPKAQSALRDGVKLVFQKFQDELSKLDVHPIEATGLPFDENKHEALMQQPAPEGTEHGTVIQELQKGYRMGDRILRHSKVIVAS